MISWENCVVGDYVVWEPKDPDTGRTEFFLGVIIEIHILYCIIGSGRMLLTATICDDTFRKATQKEIDDYLYRYYNNLP